MESGIAPISVFTDIRVPDFGFDDRQDRFLTTVHRQLREGQKQNSDVNISHGFPASEVVVGWLQGTIGRLWDAGRLREASDADAFIRYAVQRVKKVAIFAVQGKGTPQTIYFVIKTKDDNGWYCYQFTLYRLGGINMTGIRTIPHNKDFGLFSFGFRELSSTAH